MHFPFLHFSFVRNPLTVLLIAIVTSMATAPVQGSSKRFSNTPAVHGNAYPWVVQLTTEGSGCSAAQINDRWLVTAAHCIPPNSRQTMLYYSYSRSGLGVAAKRVIRHPNFSLNDYQYLYRGNPPQKDSRYKNDIALIELRRPVSLSSYASIQLDKSVDQLIAENPTAQAKAAGFNNNEKTLYVPDVSIENADTLDGVTIIAARRQKGADEGNSGGPVFLEKGHRKLLLGVTTDRNHYDHDEFFAEPLAAHKQFIESQMNQTNTHTIDHEGILWAGVAVGAVIVTVCGLIILVAACDATCCRQH